MKTQPAAFRSEERLQESKRAYVYRFAYGASAFFYTSLDKDLFVGNGPPAKMSSNQIFTAAPVAHSRIVESVDSDERGATVRLGAIDQQLRKYFLTVSPKEIDVDIWRVASSLLPGPVEYADALRNVFSGIADSLSFDDVTIAAACVQRILREDRVVPRFNYQPVCNHILYGPHCKANRDLFTVSVSLSAVNYPGRFVEVPVSSINVDTPPRAVTVTQETFEGGTVRTAAGEDMGVLACTVITGGVRLYMEWMARGMQPGQTVNVDCGCLHIKRTCDVLFSNLPNFGGHPYIPVNNPAVDGINL